jgi:hypothetical protein
MYYLTDDPTYVAVTLGAFAVVFLIALKVTQQGKFLIWASVLGLLAIVVVIGERLYVTDNERIEAVVNQLTKAVSESDGDAVLAMLTDDVILEPRFVASRGLLAREFIRSQLKQTKFEFLSIQHLETQVGAESRRGSASFEVLGAGNWQSNPWGIRPGDTAWSLGFQEMPDKSWKVNRITAIHVPVQVERALGMRSEN